MISKIVTEKPLLRLPLTQPSGIFVLQLPGNYSIWQKVSGVRRTRIEMGLPNIVQQSSGESIVLNKTMAMITANDGSGTRRQLYTFSVPAAGEYRIAWPPDAAAGANSSGLLSGNASAFSLEVRKPMPVLKLVGSILGIIAGFAMLVGGVIGVILAGRIL